MYLILISYFVISTAIIFLQACSILSVCNSSIVFWTLFSSKGKQTFGSFNYIALPPVFQEFFRFSSRNLCISCISFNRRIISKVIASYLVGGGGGGELGIGPCFSGSYGFGSFTPIMIYSYALQIIYHILSYHQLLTFLPDILVQYKV